MSITEKLLCSKSHEYLLLNDDNTYTIGLTDYAVEQLGDIVFIELPEVGNEFKKGESFGAVESVKAASEIYMPISGKVIEINESLVDSPETLNDDVYKSGWLIKIEATGEASEQDDLMEYEDYKEDLE
ncbi:glycine cleavage system protein GcvH [Spirochaetes bacterium]|uniref:Glycine cleavage system H protein n=1 Tax=Candidatus Scatousia excrementipullorum TaxID=2840936 RepID=A0A9D9GZF2_9BACT|nr:glycine cleavage system protein GcvH [Candidatus Scatousia excrementipullorum]